MRAAYFRGGGLIEYAEVPTPHPGPGEVLIRVAANGVCGSDHKALERGHKTLPGHEGFGTVVQVGEGCALASHTYPLERLAEAYALFHAGNALKVWVEP